MAAAASATLTNKRSKAPVSSEGVGDVTARDSTGATVTVTLDVSLAECMDALHGLTDRLLKDADGAADAATFKRFWAKLRKAVSNAGSARTSVGEGLLRAGQAMAQSDEVVGMAREAKKEAPSRAAIAWQSNMSARVASAHAPFPFRLCPNRTSSPGPPGLSAG